MIIGYARVSTDDQNFSLQRAALEAAGCKRIFEEKISGAKRDRPELIRMLDQTRDGDVVVVSRLDRLARSTRHLLEIAERLRDAQAGLRSLHEPWADTTSPAGRMVLTIFAGIAEFERELIHERTGSGRDAAKARGVRFGRPPETELRSNSPRPAPDWRRYLGQGSCKISQNPCRDSLSSSRPMRTRVPQMAPGDTTVGSTPNRVFGEHTARTVTWPRPSHTRFGFSKDCLDVRILRRKPHHQCRFGRDEIDQPIDHRGIPCRATQP
jgi:DNA invertase Pin-like site-specific DNA recombinase